jgi:hypothetical protein
VQYLLGIIKNVIRQFAHISQLDPLCTLSLKGFAVSKM